MAKNKSLRSLPKMHTFWRKRAEEVAHILYSGAEKDVKNARLAEIQTWLAEGGFVGTESAAELAREWQLYADDAEREEAD